MARTSTTRTGNGGWGGPKKGAGNKGAGPGRPKGMKPGEGKLTVADRMVAMGLEDEAAQAWARIIRDPEHPQHASMVEKAATRMNGQPQQDVTSGGEKIAPLVVEIVRFGADQASE